MAFCRLAEGSEGIKQALVSAGAVDALVKLARSGAEKQARFAAEALESLAEGSEGVKQLLMAAGAAIRPGRHFTSGLHKWIEVKPAWPILHQAATSR